MEKGKVRGIVWTRNEGITIKKGKGKGGSEGGREGASDERREVWDGEECGIGRGGRIELDLD